MLTEQIEEIKEIIKSFSNVDQDDFEPFSKEQLNFVIAEIRRNH